MKEEEVRKGREGEMKMKMKKRGGRGTKDQEEGKAEGREKGEGGGRMLTMKINQLYNPEAKLKYVFFS